jgi:hypothetical protein
MLRDFMSSNRKGALLLVFCLAAAFFLASGMALSRSHAQPAAPVATVPAVIATDTTWTKANSPYYVDSNVAIQSGVTVTIEPGVRVIFNNKYYIFVYSGSSIIAKGTPTEHITFEQIPGYFRWKKIWFYGNTTSYLRYVDFSGGGSDSSGEAAVLEFDGPGTHVLNNCTINGSNRQGIAAVGSGLNIRIAGLLIRDCDTYSLRVDNGPNVLVTGSTFEKVRNDAVFVPPRTTVSTFVITGSNFLNGAALINQMESSVCVNAQENWWGAVDGPSGGGGGACGVPGNAGGGSPVSAGVDVRYHRTTVAPRVGITTTPVASFTVSPDPSIAQPPNTPYTFDGSVSTDVEDYASSLDFCWDWEDNGGGCDATAMTAVHSFPTGGWHTTRLVITDTDGLTSTATQNILSGWAPTATFIITPTSGAWSEFQFDASGSSDVETTDKALLQAYWDWEGDEVLDTGPYSVTHVLTHSYSHIGRYWPTVSVVDTDTVTGTYSLQVDVIPPAASTTIGGGVGTLVSADETVTVTVAGGVISDGTVITHTPWITVPTGYGALPGDFTYQGFNLSAGPVGSASGPFTITVDYDLDYYGNVLDLSASESLLRLYRWDGSEWVLVPSAIVSGQLEATTDSFGDFALVLEAQKVYLPLVLQSY